ncbi:MAG: SprT family zinc-dependent metalloprotease [Parvularculaceae bacterium]
MTPESRAFAVDPAVGASIDLGDRQVAVIVRVNRKARRLIVRVDALAGVVLVTSPSKRALPEALRFAQTKADWIRRQFDHGETPRPFGPGALCPYRGVFHKVMLEGSSRTPVRRIEEPEPLLLVGGDAAHVNRRLSDWLKHEARREIAARVEIHAATLGRRVVRISVRDQASRWGSCSGRGALSFSWRLILAPPDMLDSVAAHECAHLVHLDHSPAFWRTVASLGVDIDGSRAWFRRHGDSLRAWGV